MFANCPRLNWMACSYLLLAQNNVQSVLEFETYCLWVYVAKTQREQIGSAVRLLDFLSGKRTPLRLWALRQAAAEMDKIAAPFLGSCLPAGEYVPLLREVISKHDRWLFNLDSSYGGWSITPAPTIVVTEAPFEGNYFGWGDSDIAVISVLNWHRYFAPPSVLEFTLNLVQRYALRMVVMPGLGSHYPTRGCIWDFAANVEDIRASVLCGYLCGSCEAALSTQLSAESLKSIKELLKNQWVGRAEDAGTVAGNIKRVFRYDLSRTTGLRRSLWDRIAETGLAEVVKWAVVFLLGLLTARFIGSSH